MLQAAYDKQVIERKALVKSILTSMVREQIVHDHTLRVLRPTVNNQSKYDYSLIKGVSTTAPGEVLLTKQDAFALVAVSVVVGKGVGTVDNYTMNGQPLYPYVDPIVFPGAAAGSAAAGGAGSVAYLEAEGMQNLLTGFLDLKESSTEIMYKLDVRKLTKMPARGVDVSAEMPNVRLLPIVERINENNGSYLAGKEILFTGDQDINAYLTMEGTANLAQLESPFPTAEVNVIGFEFHGFLIRGGAGLSCIKNMTVNGVNNLCTPENVEAASS